MIVPMIQYEFLLYHKDLEPFLEAVREQGVVDVTRREYEPSPQEKTDWQTVGRYNKAVEYLQEAVRKRPAAPQAVPLPDGTEAQNVLQELEQLRKEQEELQNRLDQLQKEADDLSVWGDFDLQAVRQLEQAQCALRFFSADERRFDPAWEAGLPLAVTGNRNGRIYFVAVQSPLNANEEADGLWKAMTDTAEPCVMPSRSLTDVRQLTETGRERLEKVSGRMQHLTAALPMLEEARDELLSGLDFKSAALSAASGMEGRLALIKGFVPIDRDEAFRQFLATQPVVFNATPVSRQKEAPILLKNNWFAKYFEPICAINSMPVYGEIDMTPFMAPFFWLFYGFCLGDGGYGLLFIVTAAIAKRRMKPAMRPVLTLVQFFGLSTVLFGILTGSFFGIALGDLAVFAGVKDKFLDSGFLFPLSLIIGLIQILFGMCLKVVNITRMQGWRHAVSTASWLWLMLSTIACYLLSERAGMQAFALGEPVHLALAGLAAVGIFFFNSPGKNPLVNVGSGLWDTYNMVTGMVGDLLSYIRLFVLCLSGSILGAVFNTLAFGLSPDIPVLGFLISLIILLFGHGINIFMNGLGSFVHTIRLTFLEFYKAAGYNGGGTAYHPFRTRHPQQQETINNQS